MYNYLLVSNTVEIVVIEVVDLVESSQLRNLHDDVCQETGDTEQNGTVPSL